eukprot:TRINITY_DN4867_c0_g1_i1.p1 TRINITY_DN4867_c0_g1~~TRINITY_DN4867_c0_g1_i1.p1  ORF type:complete len:253 (-),score=78.27 TRINITY_DN4867_c0_g1_i1:52-810(-)
MAKAQQGQPKEKKAKKNPATEMSSKQKTLIAMSILVGFVVVAFGLVAYVGLTSTVPPRGEVAEQAAETEIPVENQGPFMARTFGQLDRDQDESLSPEEVSVALKAVGLNSLVEDSQRFTEWFARVDTDVDGKVSHSELEAFVGQQLGGIPEEQLFALRAAFAASDLSGDDQLTPDEFTAGMERLSSGRDQKQPSKEQLEQIVSMADQDKSNTLNFREFVSILAQGQQQQGNKQKHRSRKQTPKPSQSEEQTA